MKKRILLLCLMGILLASCNTASNDSMYGDTLSSYSDATEQPAHEKCYSTIADVEKNIDGTIWTYTEVGSELWFKYVFHDGVVDFYCSFPAKGEWGDVNTTYTYYEVAEHRYSNTGERYISVDVKNDPAEEHWSLQIIPSTGQASLGFGDPFLLEPHDYEWD